MSASLTPEFVRSLTEPTKRFLCPLSANTYGVEFLSFVISDYETKDVIFDVAKDYDMATADLDPSDPDSARTIRYSFSADVLRCPAIATDLTFCVGTEPVINMFEMVERHYFRGELVKSYDFQFGFCIPGSTNTWQAVYDVPPMSESRIADMVAEPWATESDSFYFVNGELVMHNKALYRYNEPEESRYAAASEGKLAAAPASAAGGRVDTGHGKAESKYEDESRYAAKLAAYDE